MLGIAHGRSVPTAHFVFLRTMVSNDQICLLRRNEKARNFVFKSRKTEGREGAADMQEKNTCGG